MTEAEARRLALAVASDAIDKEADWPLRIHWERSREETRTVAAHLERLTRALSQRTHPQVPRPRYPDAWWWRDD